MLNIRTKSQKELNQVSENPMRFFDPNWIGLDLIRLALVVALRYPGSGFVSIQVEREGNFAGVKVQTQEWEYQADNSSTIQGI